MQHLDVLDTNNVVLRVHCKLLLLGRMLPRVLRRKDLVQFFKSAILGLRDEEVDDSGLEEIPDDEDNVCLPRNGLERYRPGELIDQTSSTDGEVGESHALGAHFKGQDLDRVECLQGSEAKGVYEAENIDKSESCVAGWEGRGWRWNTVIVTATVSCKGSSRCGNTDPDASATKVGEEEKWATAESVNTSSTDQSHDEG